MGLETGTYVSDLVTSNPVNSDLELQGAAHLRLLKTVLQNTFPGASRPVGVDRILSKTSDYSILQGDAMTTFLIDTTGGIVNLTLPTLASSDAGWQVFVVKTNTGTSPVLIKPPTGTLSSGDITGLSATRRCIPNVKSRVWWTGTAFICDRAVGVTVGSCIEFHGASLPVGYEWPNGQTLASASTNYPDFYSRNGSSGVTLDRRQRLSAGGNLGGASPARITTAGSGVDGTTVGASGGLEAEAIVQANFLSTALNLSSAPGTGTVKYNQDTIQAGTGGSKTFVVNIDSSGAHTSNNAVVTASNSINLAGSDTPYKKMPPTIITNFILVVE